MIETTKVNLAALNSATKYPSIPTFHELGEKGHLTDTIAFEPSADLVVSEKIDGTNTRLIFMPDGYFLVGSREHLLYARGDLIGNPALGIVESVTPLAERLNTLVGRRDDTVKVVFLETYGGKTTAGAKNYTGERAFGHRLFDVVDLAVDDLDKDIEALAAWREAGGQAFYSETRLADFGDAVSIPLTARLEAPVVPTAVDQTLEWLQDVLPATKAALDAGAAGSPEGVVVRTADRALIAKIRFADYRRTLKGRSA